MFFLVFNWLYLTILKEFWVALKSSIVGGYTGYKTGVYQKINLEGRFRENRSFTGGLGEICCFFCRITVLTDLGHSFEGFLIRSSSGSERQSCRDLYRQKVPSLLLKLVPYRKWVTGVQIGQPGEVTQKFILSQIWPKFGNFGIGLFLWIVLIKASLYDGK